MTPADFFAAGKLRRKKVGGVLVRELTVSDREQLTQSGTVGVWEDVRKIVFLSAINEDGTRFFADEDAEKLKAMPARSLEPIARAVMLMSSLKEGADEAAEKNS